MRRWLGGPLKVPYTWRDTSRFDREHLARAGPLIRCVRSYIQSPQNGNGPTSLKPAYAALCPYHGCGMTRWEKYGRSWLSHLTEGEMWCNGRQSFRHCMQSGLVEVTA